LLTTSVAGGVAIPTPWRDDRRGVRLLVVPVTMIVNVQVLLAVISRL
jgi:hypothetical protein